MTDAVRKMVSDAAKHLNPTLEALGTLHSEMDTRASQLPEYETVMNLYPKHVPSNYIPPSA